MVFITVLVCVFIGFGYWNYLKDNSNRVIHGIDFNNDTFQSVNFSYIDLSNEVRKVVSKEEFQAWNTWEDVKNSFSKVPEIKDNGDMAFIYHGNPIGIVHTYYDLTVTGYKLRYIKFETVKNKAKETENTSKKEGINEKNEYDYFVKNRDETIEKLNLFVEDVNNGKESEVEVVTEVSGEKSFTRKLYFDGEFITTQITEFEEKPLKCSNIEKINQEDLIIYHLSKCNNTEGILQVNIPPNNDN